MKIKFVQKITRWLYDKTHDYTIADRDYKEERHELIISELKEKVFNLEKEKEDGIVECKIIRINRVPIKIHFCERVDLRYIGYDDCMPSIETEICRKIGNYLNENHLVTFKYNDDFHHCTREVHGFIELLRGERNEKE